MKISSMGRYAVRIMVELAKHGDGFLSVSELSKTQDASAKYTEKIISMLLKANLILSVRGAQGGYRLVRAPEEYSVREILAVTGDLPKLAPCLESVGCERMGNCSSLSCWEKLDGLITEYLQSVKLSDLISK
ncbi:MAG: Rrf2 family transcriptional regulator [Clostridia bacterium]|nr:Rrf2 family transcriptional regulator [Clostridia bacterium]